jgi:hypothetical protein
MLAQSWRRYKVEKIGPNLTLDRFLKTSQR